MNIPELLRENGLKVTPQRMAIYTMLNNTNSHPSAEEIYKTLLPENPTISLATVYKTLDCFKNSGLIQELSVGNGRSNYDADISPHQHIVCKKCNRIYDFQLDGLNSLRADAEEKTGFSVENEQITFYGICPSCLHN